ncbi:MAG: hypothetical protein ACO1QB_03320, partial [Verrucomicrobiales bacterium]
PLVLLTVLALALVTMGTFRLIQTMRPNVVFEEVFGSGSTSEVTNIRSSYWFLGDSGSIYMRFYCSRETFDRLLATRMPAASTHDLQDITERRLHDTPGWWIRKHVNEQLICYSWDGENRSIRNFSFESETFVYDPAVSAAYYAYSGVD